MACIDEIYVYRLFICICMWEYIEANCHKNIYKCTLVRNSKKALENYSPQGKTLYEMQYD